MRLDVIFLLVEDFCITYVLATHLSVDTCTETHKHITAILRIARCKTAMEPLEAPQRNIVVAVDASDAGLPAVQYAVSELIRPGGVLHVCHVATVLPPSTSIAHGELLNTNMQ
jgi:hypothetical protein